MLRASAEATGIDLDLAVVATGAPPPFPAGEELAALTLAMTTRPGAEPVAERAALVEAAGPDVAERAIGVCATFQMMNRLLDGVGAPVHPSLHRIATALGLDPASLPR